MNDSLTALIYISSATRLLSPDELRDLLRESRERNERVGISGMLLYKEGNFMQVIEGEGQTVRTLFKKIQSDGRHRGVMRLREERIPEREFPGWFMGFRDLDLMQGREDIPGYSEFMNTPLTGREFSGQPSRAQRLLLTFKRSM